MTTWRRIHAGLYESSDGKAQLVQLGKWGLTPKDDAAKHDPTFTTLAAAQAYYDEHPYPE